ncbi:hypothetical protein DFH27DRAFT_90800 [Peziza echinospora]|nr:hypothetical protein DFH27DRAFT_90800 [Peziza echinospora]
MTFFYELHYFLHVNILFFWIIFFLFIVYSAAFDFFSDQPKSLILVTLTNTLRIPILTVLSGPLITFNFYFTFLLFFCIYNTLLLSPSRGPDLANTSIRRHPSDRYFTFFIIIIIITLLIHPHQQPTSHHSRYLVGLGTFSFLGAFHFFVICIMHGIGRDIYWEETNTFWGYFWGIGEMEFEWEL